VSRRVGAAAAAYCRHRIRYKNLAGANTKGWERHFQALRAADVRGLSKRSITAMEIEERYRTVKITEAIASINKANISRDLREEIVDVDEESELADYEPTTTTEVLDGALAVGEGHHKMSWIWVAGLELEDIHDPQLTDGKSSFTSTTFKF
jgi:hypothetical protein